MDPFAQSLFLADVSLFCFTASLSYCCCCCCRQLADFRQKRRRGEKKKFFFANSPCVFPTSRQGQGGCSGSGSGRRCISGVRQSVSQSVRRPWAGLGRGQLVAPLHFHPVFLFCSRAARSADLLRIHFFAEPASKLTAKLWCIRPASAVAAAASSITPEMKRPAGDLTADTGWIVECTFASVCQVWMTVNVTRGKGELMEGLCAQGCFQTDTIPRQLNLEYW